METNIHRIARINPSVTTSNLGDFIIEDYCKKALSNIFGDYMAVDIPIHDHLSRYTSRQAAIADYTIVCGTNILAANMNKERQWMMRISDALKIRYGTLHKVDIFRPFKIKEKISETHVILLGVGWHEYQGDANFYTRKLLNLLLDKEFFHSVRDSYTEEKLKAAGIKNVINTACPTMWGLTTEHCSKIPTKKAKNVICTLTDYRKAPERDKKFIDTLLKEYETVSIWLQSYEDYNYIHELGYGEQVSIIPPILELYDNFLKNQNDVDYIGIRLHGGIRALNMGIRTCIISVDNRSKEISRDTGLPVVEYDDSMENITSWIYGNKPTVIHLPEENIKRWMNQFSE